ncbi:MAG TPA: aquaporin [Acidimicrobiales bacterium]|nr:aquaporin [Acidimicrobiales bacterium]
MGRRPAALTARGAGGGVPAAGGWHPVDWGCELVGTALLVFFGLSAVTLDFGPHSPVASVVPSPSARLLLTGVLFAGAGALVTVSPMGRRSGAHLNPAVTLAFWLQRHVHLHDLVGYVVAQCAGGLVGAEALRLAWDGRAAAVGFGRTAPRPGLGPMAAIGLEALMTGLLILVIFSFLSSPRTARWTPWAVLVTVALEVWRGAPYTGTSLNPARSLGPAIVSGHLGGLWIYLVAPLAGATVAAGVWVLAPRALVTAKLFHDPRYRSVLRSLLPTRPAPALASGS